MARSRVPFPRISFARLEQLVDFSVSERQRRDLLNFRQLHRGRRVRFDPACRRTESEKRAQRLELFLLCAGLELPGGAEGAQRLDVELLQSCSAGRGLQTAAAAFPGSGGTCEMRVGFSSRDSASTRNFVDGIGD